MLAHLRLLNYNFMYIHLKYSFTFEICEKLLECGCYIPDSTKRPQDYPEYVRDILGN